MRHLLRYGEVAVSGVGWGGGRRKREQSCTLVSHFWIERHCGVRQVQQGELGYKSFLFLPELFIKSEAYKYQNSIFM
jgi:hypothetical protein